jgi:uncharacterized membrane protein
MHDLLLQVTHAGGTGQGIGEQLLFQVLRWAHFFFGIAWIGHLYYFNFVQAHAEKALGGDHKKIVVPNFRGRAIWWFRWGAMLTFLTGWAYIFLQEAMNGNAFKGWLTFGAGGQAATQSWILFGGLLGSIMWFNVWFVIWPRQRVIIAAVGGQREKPADFDALVAVAGKFSRINTYLSVPMLFGMGARSHFPVAGNWGEALAWMGGVFAVGFGIAYHVVNQAASNVGTEFLPPPAPAAAAPPPPPAPKP